MRTAFIDELAALARVRPDVFLVVGDLGFSVVENYAAEFPERFLNAGVAEQNMMGVAAGLASEGYHPFAYSIGNFSTFRCAEQIRNDVDYHNLPVTIVSVGGGVAYGNLGYSHHAVQDYALLRTMPNILIAAPGDPLEARACLRYIIQTPQPSYLRLGKAGEKILHKEMPELAPGQWVTLVEGNQPYTLLTTGATLPLALSWLERPEFRGYSLHSLPLWGLKLKSLQRAQAARFKKIVSVEDHILDGGFGSWLSEALSGCGTEVEIRALSSDIFGKVGSQAYLNGIGGLS